MSDPERKWPMAKYKKGLPTEQTIVNYSWPNWAPSPRTADLLRVYMTCHTLYVYMMGVWMCLNEIL